jgi:hypothetical protein
MQVVGGDDDQQFHALIGGQPALDLKHLLPVGVAAGTWQAQSSAGVLIVAGVATERTAHQFKTTVESGGLAVSPANERALPATDEAHSYFCPCIVHRNASLQVLNLSDVTGYIAAEI